MCILAIYGHMIYTAPYVLVWMQADPLRGQVEGGWARLLGPVKWHQVVRRVPFEAPNMHPFSFQHGEQYISKENYEITVVISWRRFIFLN
jgi:hypothetical protein